MEQHRDRKNMQAVGIGLASIALIGLFFIGKSFFDNDRSEENSLSERFNQDNQISRQTLTPQELQAKINRKENLSLVDIRDKASYQAKHIPQSRSFPSETLNAFTKDSDALVVIIGSVDNPEANSLAEAILKEKDIDSWFLAGGFESWVEKGYPTISEGNPSDFVDQSKVTFITKENLLPLIGQKTVTLLDTQSDENYNRKHIKGSVHIPLDQLERRRDEIPSNQRLIVYGENELESFRAGVKLFDLNIFNTETLRGNDHLKEGSSLPLEP